MAFNLLVAGITVALATSGCVTTASTPSEGIRSQFYDFVADPFFTNETEAVRFLQDGLLVIGDDGLIMDFGAFEEVSPKYPGLPITSYPDRVVMPGFIDTHTHYVQAAVTAAYGQHKPEWLQKYIFPAEEASFNYDYASNMAAWYLDEMVRQGTTTMQTFTNTRQAATDAFFNEASKRNMRVIAGVTGTDRVEGTPDGVAPATGAPASYVDTAQSFRDDTIAMYNKWHGVGRNLYAVSPRFALGDTEALLATAGELYQTLPGAYMNTHVAEPYEDGLNALKLFPTATDYLDVFGMNGLIGPRATFGHAIWLSEADFKRLADAGANAAHCPASNLFLGSGFFPLKVAKSPDVRCMVTLGTDLAGGNYFSHLRVLNDAYKVQIWQNYSLSAAKGLYLATLGGAQALELDDKIGSFKVGNEADFVVWDVVATRILRERNQNATMSTPDELEFKMFGLMMLGDDRSVDATYVMGKKVYDRETEAGACTQQQPVTAETNDGGK